MTDDKHMLCSICGNQIAAEGTWLGGHNAEPINEGRCCRRCNDTVVIPARVLQIYRADRELK